MNDEQRLPARAKEVERTPPMVVRETANGWERQIPGTSSEREKEGCPQGSNRAKLARRASGAGKCETRWDESYDGQSYTHIHVEFLWVDGDSQENPCCGKPEADDFFYVGLRANPTRERAQLERFTITTAWHPHHSNPSCTTMGSMAMDARRVTRGGCPTAAQQITGGLTRDV